MAVAAVAVAGEVGAVPAVVSAVSVFPAAVAWALAPAVAAEVQQALEAWPLGTLSRKAPSASSVARKSTMPPAVTLLVRTQAGGSIRQAIQRALPHTSRAIRLPVAVAATARRAGRVAAALEAESGVAPLEEDVAARLGMPTDRLRWLLTRAADTTTVSLDAGVGGNGSGSGIGGSGIGSSGGRGNFTLGDLIECHAGDSPEVAVGEAMLREDVASVLRVVLPEEELAVVVARYGLDGGGGGGVTELARRWQIPSSRVRQAEERALRRLRKVGGSAAFTLRDYVEV